MPVLLALDDNRTILDLRSAVFSALGYEVVAFEDARRALARIARGDIDVIVTDYEMPQINGVSFAKQARSAGFDGRIVMATGAAKVEAAQALWVDDLVLKGESASSLVAAVGRSATAIRENAKC